MDEQARRALELLAVEQPLGLPLLERLCGGAAVEAVLSRGLAEIGVDRARSPVRLAHPLYGEVLVATTTAGRLREAKRVLADAIHDAGARRPNDVVRIATWRLELGDHSDPSIFDEAVWRVRDPDLAERMALAAVAGARGFAALRSLGDALQAAGRWAAAEEVLAEAAGYARTDEDVAVLAGARAPNLFWGLGRTAEAIAHIESAREGVTDPVWRTVIDTHDAAMRVFDERHRSGVELARQVLATSPASEDVRARACMAVAVGEAVAGRFAAARDAVAEGLGPAMSVAERNPRSIGWIYGARFLADWLAGELDEAGSIVEMLYGFGQAQGAAEILSAAAMGRGRIALARGDLAGAVPWLSEAIVALRVSDPGGFLRFCLSGLAQAKRRCQGVRGGPPHGRSQSGRRRSRARVGAGVRPGGRRARTMVLARPGQ